MASELRGDENGAALIEAALVLPVLLILIFGLMDISLYFWNWGLAAKAAQLGARRAVVSDAVAIGPGLDLADSATYWDGLPPGAPCYPSAGAPSICPDFSVSCDVGGCHCTRGVCRYTFSPARLTPILNAMRAAMPDLKPNNVQITYSTNGLGYVDRPVPIPVDVRVSLIGLTYKPLFLGDILGPSLPLRATAQLPGEDLRSQR